MISRSKVYCLGCNRISNCVCGNTLKQFPYSHKLQVPAIKNKVKFRQFLNDCPIFVNSVPPELYEDFRSMLRDIKYTGGVINGKSWTKLD